MSSVPDAKPIDGVPTYLGRGDPAGTFADYYPAWVDKMAADITLEGSLLDGVVQGADAVRAVIGGVRFSRLLREKLADTPYAEHFLAGDAERT
jgi:hypothetical protein